MIGRFRCYEIPSYRLAKVGYPRRGSDLAVIKKKCIINENGCWIYQGDVNSAGYGRINRRKIRYFVHRLAYEVFYGKKLVNQGCHKCNTKLCCNPEHIVDKTQSENIQQWHDRA